MPTVTKENNRYVVRDGYLILASGETAQAIANYLEAMRLKAYWKVGSFDTIE